MKFWFDSFINIRKTIVDTLLRENMTKIVNNYNNKMYTGEQKIVVILKLQFF